jgi:hypothetical protein
MELQFTPPSASGTLWLDRTTIESRYPIDTDGDMQYTDAEVLAVRNSIAIYVGQNLLFLFKGHIRIITPQNLTIEPRPGSDNEFLKLTFTIDQIDDPSSLMIISRLLADVWRRPACLANLHQGDDRRLVVLTPWSYYDPRPTGDRGRATTQGTGPRTREAPRYGCQRMCLGVEMNRPDAKCPRCGASVLPVFAGRIPGVGQIGPRGGSLVPFHPSEFKLEGLMASDGEFRIYLTNEAMERLPIGRMAGTAQMWTDKVFESTTEPQTLTISPDGSHLTASVPKGMARPIVVRCTLDASDGLGRRMATFQLSEVTPVK